MHLVLRDGLPFVEVSVELAGAAVIITDVLVDTGSASTVLSVDRVAGIGLAPEARDRLRTLRGVGGRELVYTRRVDRLMVGELGVADFEVEVGGMDYGFTINGILGMDFLTRTGARIDLRKLTLD
jgi:predicted aspartyl protease